MAATRSDEGQRQCCLDHVRIWSSGPSTKSGGLVKNRHGGAPEGAPAGHTAGGTLQKCQTKTVRLTRAPLPHGREGRKEGGAPRPYFSGAAGACLHACSAPQNMTTAPREAAKLRATIPTGLIK